MVENIHNPISLAITEGFEDVRATPPERLEKLSSKVRGQMATEFIWKNVERNLTGLSNIQFCKKLGFFKVIVDNQLIIRFKRLNADLCAASEDTDQAIKWFGNEPIDGISSTLTRLTIGYHASKDWLMCEKCYITYQLSFTQVGWANEFPVFDTATSSLPLSEQQHGLPPIALNPVISIPEVQFSLEEGSA